MARLLHTLILTASIFGASPAWANTWLNSARLPGHRAIRPVIVAMSFICVLGGDGVVSCKGDNLHGELGDGTTTSRWTDAPVLLPEPAIGLALGYQNCALLQSGRVACWGQGPAGSPLWVTPKIISGLNGVVALSGGGGHMCALIVDGTLRCWGWNDYGELGDNTGVTSYTPVVVVAPSGSGPLTGVTAIDSGAWHTCAIAGGAAYCWGLNSKGQLGDGTTTNRPRPVPVLGAGAALRDITVGNSTTCSLEVSGVVHCWGSGTYGQLGNGAVVDSSTPTTVSGITTATQVALGAYAGCALLANGQVKCWGARTDGDLGDGAPITWPWSISPVPVATLGTTNNVAIYMWWASAVAVRADGSVAVWGEAAQQHAGLGTFGALSTPTVMSRPYNVVVAKVTGTAAFHSCAVKLGGQPYCWGYNGSGLLGDGTTTNRTSPVSPLGLSNVKAMSLGAYHTLALSADGRVYSWGYNLQGQLGDGTTTQRNSPTLVPGLSDVVAIAAGYYHSCALTAQAQVYCWGYNARGQIGDNTTTQRNSPVLITGRLPIGNTLALTAGNQNTCAQTAIGQSYCWGENTLGMLGNGTATDSLIPSAVYGTTSELMVTAGKDHGCVQGTNGNLRCFGANTYGDYGNGSTTVSYVPASPAWAYYATAAAGHSYTCGIDAISGNASCFGYGGYGALGTGSTSSSTSPVNVAGPAGVTSIAPALFHTCEYTAAGHLYCWGSNDYGQLGIGSTTAKLSPVAVLGF